MKRSRVTIKTIAEKAGLSCGSVSQVLANPQHPRFPPETRKKIIQVADELNYRPNRFAIGLRRQKVNLIVLVVPWNCPELVDSIETKVREVDFQLMISQTPLPIKGAEEKALMAALDWQPDGIIWMPSTADSEYKNIIQHIKAWHGKVVLLHHKLKSLPDMDVVRPEAITSVRRAVEHIASQGYRKIVYVSLPQIVQLDRIRLNTLEQTAKQYNIDFDRIKIDSNEETKQYQKYLSQITQPTAFICQGDWHAIEILEVAEQLKLNCPDEIGIISIGDFLLGNRIRICEVARPRITAIREPFNAIAETTVRLLIDRIVEQIEVPAQNIEVAEELIIRQSTLKTGVSR